MTVLPHPPPWPDAPPLDAEGFPRAAGDGLPPAAQPGRPGFLAGVLTGLAMAVLLAGAALVAGPAWPHEAPAGWAYDRDCCSGIDCAPVPARAVTLAPGAAGWRLRLAPGDHPFVPPGGVDVTVPFGDRRLRRSGDGGWHACLSAAGGRLLCLYEPERLG